MSKAWTLTMLQNALHQMTQKLFAFLLERMKESLVTLTPQDAHQQERFLWLFLWQTEYVRRQQYQFGVLQFLTQKNLENFAEAAVMQKPNFEKELKLFAKKCVKLGFMKTDARSNSLLDLFYAEMEIAQEKNKHADAIEYND